MLCILTCTNVCHTERTRLTLISAVSPHVPKENRILLQGAAFKALCPAPEDTPPHLQVLPLRHGHAHRDGEDTTGGLAHDTPLPVGGEGATAGQVVPGNAHITKVTVAQLVVQEVDDSGFPLDGESFG